LASIDKENTINRNQIKLIRVVGMEKALIVLRKDVLAMCPNI